MAPLSAPNGEDDVSHFLEPDFRGVLGCPLLRNGRFASSWRAVPSPDTADFARVISHMPHVAAYLNCSKTHHVLPQKTEINLAARLTNAALITISAGRLGIRVLTAYERAFCRLCEFRTF